MNLIVIKKFLNENNSKFIGFIFALAWLFLLYFTFSPLSDKDLKEFVSESSCHYRQVKEELESNNNSITKFITWEFRMICFQEKRNIEESKLISKQISIIKEVNKEKNLDYDFNRIPVF